MNPPLKLLYRICIDLKNDPNDSKKTEKSHACVGLCNVFSKAIPRTNTVWKERLSIWINVVTDVAELLRMFFPGTHISLFQT